MIENVEVRKCENGYVVTVHTEDAETEYVFDNIRKVLKFLKENLDPKGPN